MNPQTQFRAGRPQRPQYTHRRPGAPVNGLQLIPEAATGSHWRYNLHGYLSYLSQASKSWTPFLRFAFGRAQAFGGV